MYIELGIKIAIGLKSEIWKDILFIMTFSISNNSCEELEGIVRVGFVKEELKESPLVTRNN